MAVNINKLTYFNECFWVTPQTVLRQEKEGDAALPNMVLLVISRDEMCILQMA